MLETAPIVKHVVRTVHRYNRGKIERRYAVIRILSNGVEVVLSTWINLVDAADVWNDYRRENGE